MAPSHPYLRIALLALAGACAAPAVAADDRWDVRAVPYVWGASVQGNAHLRGLPPIVIDRSFRDTLSDLDMAGMVVVEARRGQWGLLSDITYIDTTQHVEVSPLGLDGRFGNRATTASLMVTYRAIDEGGFSLDVLAGARHWDATFDLALDTPLALRRRTDIAWIDPALGLRAGWRPAPQHGLTI